MTQMNLSNKFRTRNTKLCYKSVQKLLELYKNLPKAVKIILLAYYINYESDKIKYYEKDFSTIYNFNY